jgi:hypothetical protein
MKLYRNIVLFFTISLLLTNTCLGASGSTGTTGGAFLKLGSGSRAAAMGDTYIAVSDDPSAIYWNPAGLSQIKSFMLSSIYINWLVGISSSNISMVRPLGRSTLGVSLDYVNVGGIEETTLTQPGGTGRIISPTDYVLTASFSRRFWPELSIGINAKLISENIDNNIASGYGMDLGLLWHVRNDISFGLNARNFLGTLGKNSLPSNFGIGISYKNPNFLLAADFNVPNDNISTLHLGAEYNFKNILLGRIGYNTRMERNSGGSFAVGLGLNWNTVKFDYAYVPYGDLGATHLFSLGILPFGIPKSELTEIRILSPTKTIRAGDAIKLEAEGFDDRGDKIDILPTWEVREKIGTIETNTGLFYASYAGTGEVIAKVGKVIGTTSISVVPGKLLKIVVSPLEAKVQLGKTLKFKCKGFDKYGNYIEVSALWFTEGEIGEISTNGEFMATAVGDGIVIAKVGDLMQKVGIKVIPSKKE